MTPGEKGQLAVKILCLWTVLSILFCAFVWPHLARLIEEKRRQAIDKRRQAMVARQEKAYAEASRIIIDEEIERECAIYEEDLRRKASLILLKLDEDAAQDFAGEVDAAQAILEYRASSDGRRTA